MTHRRSFRPSAGVAATAAALLLHLSSASLAQSAATPAAATATPLSSAPRWSHVLHDAPGDGRLPGGQSRWNAKKDLTFTPLRPDLVAEVAYERGDNGRFRHSCRFQHWRPDRTPESCTFQTDGST